MIKFEIEKVIAFIRSDQVEARRGCMLVAIAAIKQLEVMILETSKKWDRQRDRRAEPIGELVKVELKG